MSDLQAYLLEFSGEGGLDYDELAREFIESGAAKPFEDAVEKMAKLLYPKAEKSCDGPLLAWGKDFSEGETQ